MYIHVHVHEQSYMLLFFITCPRTRTLNGQQQVNVSTLTSDDQIDASDDDLDNDGRFLDEDDDANEVHVHVCAYK